MSTSNPTFYEVYNAVPNHIHHGKLCEIIFLDGELKITPLNDQIISEQEAVSGNKRILIPGFIELHSEINEPGREDRETLAQTIELAKRGGYIALAGMPATQPVVDNRTAVDYIRKNASNALCELLPVGAVTKGLNGQELSEMFDMKSAGAVAFSDYKNRHVNTKLLLLSMQYARQLDVPLMICPGDVYLMKYGIVNEGFNATKLGLKSIPSIAESISVQRDIELVRYTGCRVHFQSISTLEGLELIKQAKEEGLPITADINFYHLISTDECLHTFDSNYKTDPPIRDEQTRKALLQALKDGIIDAIAADHQPRTYEEKICEFDKAHYGMFTLPFVFSALWSSGQFSLQLLIEKLHTGPKNILQISSETTEKYLLLNPGETFSITPDDYNTFSCNNSPFFSSKLKGKIECIISETICEKVS